MLDPSILIGQTLNAGIVDPIHIISSYRSLSPYRIIAGSQHDNTIGDQSIVN